MHVQSVQNYCFSLSNIHIYYVLVTVDVVVVVAQAPYYPLAADKYSRHAQYFRMLLLLAQFERAHPGTMALVPASFSEMVEEARRLCTGTVLSFDFSKAFDAVPHYILSDKLNEIDINPYVINPDPCLFESRKTEGRG